MRRRRWSNRGCGGDGGQTADAGATDGDVEVFDAAEPVLGIVTPIAGTCPAGPLPNTTCRVVDVSCPGVANMQASIRVTAATGTLAGTVLFGTGGGGDSFYDGNTTAATMMGQLASQGYQIVQRRWEQQPNGWITGPGGMLAASCRYATLLTWIYTDVHQANSTAGFCATGNSGGSTEIGYALTHWQRGDILDLAVPTGGPPMGRMDHGCLDGTEPAWLAECSALVPVGASTCTNGPACSYAPNARALIDSAWNNTSCQVSDTTFRGELLANSIASSAATLAYPTTKVDFIYGSDDCTEAVTLGLAYASLVTSAKDIVFVAGTPHATFSTVAGARAIRDSILADCIPR